METNIVNWEALFRDKKFAEAEAVIKEAVAADMTESQKAETLTGIASAFMDMTNETNTEYRDALLDVIQGLNKVDSAEKVNAEKVKLVEVRQNLQGGK